MDSLACMPGDDPDSILNMSLLPFLLIKHLAGQIVSLRLTATGAERKRVCCSSWTAENTVGGSLAEMRAPHKLTQVAVLLTNALLRVCAIIQRELLLENETLLLPSINT